MSITETTPLRPAPERILPPYCPDPGRPHGRRMRLLIGGAVSLICLVWGAAFALFAPAAIMPLFTPLPILALFVIWALPENRQAPVAALPVGLYLFMASVVLWPNYIAFAPPGIPWITMTRLTGFPLVALLLVCVSTSAEFRRHVSDALRRSPALSACVIGFTFLEMLSLLFSDSKIASMNYFINAQINWTATFFVSVYVFIKPGRVERMIRLFWWMSVPIGLIAIREYRVGHPLWAGHIPSFLHIDDPSVQRALVGMNRAGVYRAASTFGNALGLAEYISLILPFVCHYAIGAYRPSVRAAAVATIPFLLLVIGVSGSRLGLVGAFLSLAITALIWSTSRWSRDRESLMGPLVTLTFPAFFFVALLASLFVGKIRVAVWGSGANGSAASTDSRRIQFALGLPKLLRHPQGQGIGQGAQVLGYEPYGILTIDSYYLEVLLEFGFVGFILFVGIFVSAVYYCISTVMKYVGQDQEIELLKPLAVAFINFLIIKSVFSETFNHSIIFMMLGMVVALVSRLPRTSPGKGVRR